MSPRIETDAICSAYETWQILTSKSGHVDDQHLGEAWQMFKALAALMGALPGFELAQREFERRRDDLYAVLRLRGVC